MRVRLCECVLAHAGLAILWLWVAERIHPLFCPRLMGEPNLRVPMFATRTHAFAPPEPRTLISAHPCARTHPNIFAGEYELRFIDHEDSHRIGQYYTETRELDHRYPHFHRGTFSIFLYKYGIRFIPRPPLFPHTHASPYSTLVVPGSLFTPYVSDRSISPSPLDTHLPTHHSRLLYSQQTGRLDGRMYYRTAAPFC